VVVVVVVVIVVVVVVVPRLRVLAVGLGLPPQLCLRFALVLRELLMQNLLMAHRDQFVRSFH